MKDKKKYKIILKFYDSDIDSNITVEHRFDAYTEQEAYNHLNWFRTEHFNKHSIFASSSTLTEIISTKEF